MESCKGTLNFEKLPNTWFQKSSHLTTNVCDCNMQEEIWIETLVNTSMS